MTPIAGYCDARFSQLRAAFEANFRERDEIGAALCVIADDRAVVDLWGGHCDEERRRPWQHDTLVNAYSVGKGVLAGLVLGAVERGELSLDSPVSGHWPEFAVHDKSSLRLRDLLSHRAGLPALRGALPAGAAYRWRLMCEALAAERPFWPPGSAHGYHVNTFGYLVGEVLRRATGESPARAAATRVRAGLGAEWFWGVPASQHARCAPVLGPGAAPATSASAAAAAGDGLPPTAELPAERILMLRNAYFNPPGISGMGTVNSADWRLAEIPSTNGHATARGVARIYAAMLPGASPGWLGGGLRAEALAVHSQGDDLVLGRPSCFGLGFQLFGVTGRLGGGARCFGHFGYGGSLGFADPDAGIAFGYVMNRPGDRWHTPRIDALASALYACLGAPAPARDADAGDRAARGGPR